MRIGSRSDARPKAESCLQNPSFWFSKTTVPDASSNPKHEHLLLIESTPIAIRASRSFQHTYYRSIISIPVNVNRITPNLAAPEISRRRHKRMQTEEATGLLNPLTNTPTITATKTTMELTAVKEKKKPPPTSLRTFDSSDDLLQEEEGQITTEDTHENHHEDDTESKEARRALLWDCRAVYLMPHSPKMLLKAGVAYVRSYHNLLEVAFLGVFLLLCYLLPDHIVDQYVRPIPYQVVDNQTLIDLTFGNDYHHNETIPGSLLNLICVVFPMCVFGLGIIFGPLGDYHAALCSYLLAMGLKIFVVACTKSYAGKELCFVFSN